jgi:hypothetical protein
MDGGAMSSVLRNTTKPSFRCALFFVVVRFRDWISTFLLRTGSVGCLMLALVLVGFWSWSRCFGGSGVIWCCWQGILVRRVPWLFCSPSAVFQFRHELFLFFCSIYSGFFYSFMFALVSGKILCSVIVLVFSVSWLLVVVSADASVLCFYVLFVVCLDFLFLLFFFSVYVLDLRCRRLGCDGGGEVKWWWWSRWEVVSCQMY